jgi:uncharacterized membrane protein YphA (DoxX/SURF4 family)
MDSNKNLIQIISESTDLKTIGIYILTFLLSIFFIYVSYKKFTSNPVTVGHFKDWGLSMLLLKLIAYTELIGAILLLFPITATSGALLLSFLMIGATYTLICHSNWNTAFITMATFILLVSLGVLRWDRSWILNLVNRLQ